MGGRTCFFNHDFGGMNENHYALLSNAFAALEDMTDREDLLLQDMATFDDETIYTFAAMLERMNSLLGCEKSINTDWLLRWRDSRIKHSGEIVYDDDDVEEYEWEDE